MPVRSINTTIRVRVNNGQSDLMSIPVVGFWSPNLGEAAHLSGEVLKRERAGQPWPGMTLNRDVPGRHVITTNDDGFWTGTEGTPGIVHDWPGVLKPGQVAISIDLLDAGDWGNLAGDLLAPAPAPRCPHCGGLL